MLCASLLDLLEDSGEILRKAQGLITGVVVLQSRTQKSGITGNHISVMIRGEEEISEDVALEGGEPSEEVHGHVHPDHEHHHDHDHEHHHDHDHEHHHDHDHEHHHDHDHEHHHDHDHHHHTGYREICDMIDKMAVSEKVKRNAKEVYNRIAQAEASVHGTDIDHIHFHEVGSLDAVFDVTFFCMLMEEIAPERVIVSPIHVGSGNVRCAHGILPVPAPATAFLLNGVPYYSGEIRGELCTPTGAALLTHFATEFGSMPVMKVDKIGYGMGNKDFPAANCVRAFLGDTAKSEKKMVEIDFNVDDMTSEAVAYAQEKLFEAGAVEVFLTPVHMKKGRMGFLFTVICSEDVKEGVVKCAFAHTSTIGMREKDCRRYTLDRKIEEEETPFGVIRKKISSGYGVKKEKYEYDDVADAARRSGLSISEVLRQLEVK